MVTMRAGDIVVNGEGFNLARRQDGSRALSVKSVPGTESDLVDFKTWLPLGYFGIGSSIKATVANQFDAGSGVDASSWGQLRMGALITSLNLNGTSAVPAAVGAMATAEGAALTTLGPYSPTTQTLTGGPPNWLTPTNINASDNTRTSVVLGLGQTSQAILTGTYAAATIPVSGIIKGFLVEVEGSATAGCRINATLLKAGVAVGSTLTAALPVGAVAVEAFVSLGSANTLWGTTWSAAEVAAVGFGVQITVTDTGGAGNTTNLDSVRITVYYVIPSNTRFLYIGAGAKLYKVNLTTLAVTGVVTFTHATAPVISDICVLKESAATSSGMILIGFGNTAQIQQIDAITLTTDSYRALDAVAAYADKFSVQQPDTSTTPNIWKSTGSTPQAQGRFTKLQSMAVDDVDRDYTSATAWNAATPTPYQIGSYGQSISDLIEWQRSLLVAKPEGIYGFDSRYNAFPVLSFTGWRDPRNGVNCIPWGRSIMIPHAKGLFELGPTAPPDGEVGPNRLVSNLSAEMRGYPQALATYGDELFVAIYTDAAHGTIFRCRRRVSENVPTALLYQPLLTYSGVATPTQMTVASDGAGTVRLFWSENNAGVFEVKYITLAPSSALRYQGGGYWRSQKFGDAHKRMVLHQITVYGASTLATGTAYWTPRISWDQDEDTTGQAIGAGTLINAPGRNTITFTHGTNDSGYLAQLVLKPTVVTATTTPNTLTGVPPLDQSEPAVLVEGAQQADTVQRVEFSLEYGDQNETGMGGVGPYDASDVKALFEGWRGPQPVTLTQAEQFGFGVQKWLEVQTVTVQSGRQREGFKPGQQLLTVTGRLV